MLYVITVAELGGAQIHLLELMRGFAGSLDLHLAVGGHGPLTDMATSLGVTTHILPALVRAVNPLKDAQALPQTIRLLRNIKPDLVHAHSSKAGLVARCAAAYCRVPAIFTAHGWEFADGLSLTRRLLVWPSEWLAARAGQRIVTVSERDAQLAVRFGIARRRDVAVIHNGITDAPEAVLAEKATPRGDAVPRLVMVARFAAPKDHLLLVRALAQVQAPFEMWFAGDGPDQAAVRSCAEESGLAGRVKFMGWQTDIPALLKQADILVLASRKEGFPLCVLEGMRAGLPVIASKVGGIAEAVEDGGTGFLVERGNGQQWRQRLETLLADQQLRERMGQAGRKLYLTKFTAQRMLENTAQVYSQVLAAAGIQWEWKAAPVPAPANSQ